MAKEYITKLIKEIFSNSIAKADSVGFLIGLLLLIFNWLVPESITLWMEETTGVEDIMDISNWIALAILIISLVTLLVYVPYKMHKQVYSMCEQISQERDDLRKQLNNYLASEPNIELAQLMDAQMYDQETKAPTVYMTQAWFNNNPQNPSEQSIAQDIDAKIEFEGNNGFRRTIFGLWAITEIPENMGFEGSEEQITIKPGNRPSKLFVAFKRTDDEECYGYCKALVSKGERGGLDPKYALPVGEYLTTIIIKGVRVKKEFRLKLINKGKDHDLKLVNI